MKKENIQVAFLGIDIAKKTFEAALKTGDAYHQGSFKNNTAGFGKLVNWVSAIADAGRVHACMEATGVHHLALAIELNTRLKSVSVVNPRRPKAFADVQLRRCKSDTVDARILADFCERMEPGAWVAPTERELEIKELARREKSLTGMASAEKNRLKDTMSDSVRASIERNIARLEEEKAMVKEELAAIIYGDPVLRNRLELMVSVPGIGEATALQLVAELGNIDWFAKARDLAAYGGLTPRHRSSGSSLNSRGGITKVGSSRLRALLYYPAMVAMRWDPIIISFAARLRDNGKTEKQIIVAVMRKLLHCIFGILKTNQPFNPDIACQN